jgi:hypothetical protein
LFSRIFFYFILKHSEMTWNQREKKKKVGVVVKDKYDDLSSGVLLPPYVFNGFLAQLTFHEMDGQPPPHVRGVGSNSKNPPALQQQQPAPATSTSLSIQ